ncbi:glycosyltransferase [Kitasatospora sp. NPDC002227]|uniref:glycosyltransferase n=1 Tax=Kitasatospora sp. NPDC002227 TaxID=3154773 RepID=UPI00331FEE6B
MPRASCSMIVKDEAATLAEVLADAAAFCDELVVADTGSTDGTQRIAAEAGAVVVEVPWTDDFAAARNASLAACTGDWVVWLDADDRVPPAAQRAFAEVIAGLGEDVDALVTPYQYGFDPTGERCTFTVQRERVLRRAAGLRWTGAVHEAVDLAAARVREVPELVVEHRRTAEQAARDQGRNLRILDGLYGRGDRTPRTLFYRANELRDHARHAEAVAAYDEALATEQPEWERYYSLLSQAESLLALERCSEAAQAALAAVQLDPGRPEAWVAAGKAYYQRKLWAEAVPFFQAATTANRRPATGFSRETDYQWVPWDFLAVCLGNSGRAEEALRAGAVALRGNPDPERVRGNLSWFVETLPAAG